MYYVPVYIYIGKHFFRNDILFGFVYFCLEQIYLLHIFKLYYITQYYRLHLLL